MVRYQAKSHRSRRQRREQSLLNRRPIRLPYRLMGRPIGAGGAADHRHKVPGARNSRPEGIAAVCARRRHGDCDARGSNFLTWPFERRSTLFLDLDDRNLKAGETRRSSAQCDFAADLLAFLSAAMFVQLAAPLQEQCQGMLRAISLAALAILLVACVRLASLYERLTADPQHHNGLFVQFHWVPASILFYLTKINGKAINYEAKCHDRRDLAWSLMLTIISRNVPATPSVFHDCGPYHFLFPRRGSVTKCRAT